MDVYQELMNAKADAIKLEIALKGLLDALPAGIENVEGLSMQHSCILGGAIIYGKEVLKEVKA